MPALPLLIAYCVVIVFASLIGGRLSAILRMTHLRTQLLMSCVGGLMLGIALLAMLPHATEMLVSASRACTGALIGLIAMFLMIRLFHTHDHGGPVSSRHHEGGHDHRHGHGHDHWHDPGIGHDHDLTDRHDAIDRAAADPPPRPRGTLEDGRKLGWFGMFFGLTLHTLIDGVALASSVMADHSGDAWLGLAGLGTFLAVALHKPLDAFAILSVMQRQQWSSQAQTVANLVFSTACPFGALAFYVGTSALQSQTELLGWGLAVSAGFFIGIALADLLPEVAFHDHDKGKLTAALLIGVGIAVGIENLPGHQHTEINSSRPEVNSEADSS
ncbi:ZIP family metal transporter [Crateriforma spongiae]|uniref:ZIP family metal transporter n=1 Tax=Crateriforma spongiae TaxID=2724528 RepID=UPI001444CD99|nr:ZIP family metal transporter [Crateriforma spongiae]